MFYFFRRLDLPRHLLVQHLVLLLVLVLALEQALELVLGLERVQAQGLAERDLLVLHLLVVTKQHHKIQFMYLAI